MFPTSTSSTAQDRRAGSIGFDPFQNSGSFCDKCGVPRAESTTLACGGCQLFQYCTRDCQRADWPDHKDFCRSKQRLVTSYVDMSVTKVSPFPGLTTKLSCLSLQKWTHRHNSALLWGCMNALQVQSNPERALTHIFYVTLELTNEARAGTRLKVNRMFRVVDAVAIEKEQLAKTWWEITPQLRVRPEKEEDVITTTIVRCGEYADFLDALHRKADLRAGPKVDNGWKATFMSATKLSDREVDVAKTDPLHCDLD